MGDLSKIQILFSLTPMKSAKLNFLYRCELMSQREYNHLRIHSRVHLIFCVIVYFIFKREINANLQPCNHLSRVSMAFR